MKQKTQNENDLVLVFITFSYSCTVHTYSYRCQLSHPRLLTILRHWRHQIPLSDFKQNYRFICDKVQAKRGHKKVRKDRSAVHRKLSQLKAKLAAAEKRAEKYHKRLQRLNHNSCASPSSHKRVNLFLRGCRVDKDIARRLLLTECVTKQLSDNAKLVTGNKQKQIFGRAVSGWILQKYRLMSAVKHISPGWQYRRKHLLQTCGKLDSYIGVA